MRFFSFLFLVLFSSGLLAQSDTIFNQTDANNRKQGYWKKNYSNGKLMYKGFFKDDKPVGEMRRYFESGALKAIMKYDISGENALTKIFYEDGSLAAQGKYMGSLKDSIWTYYSYYSRKISAIESYSKGKRDGTFINYYNNGDISEKMEYRNDKKAGLWEQFFTGNVPKLKAIYADNQLNGDFTVFYVSGQPYITGYYKNDLREGKWTIYNEDSSIENTLNYQAGKSAEEKQLTKDQQDFFKTIDEAQGKFDEPDETDFLSPSRN